MITQILQNIEYIDNIEIFLTFVLHILCSHDRAYTIFSLILVYNDYNCTCVRPHEYTDLEILQIYLFSFTSFIVTPTLFHLPTAEQLMYMSVYITKETRRLENWMLICKDCNRTQNYPLGSLPQSETMYCIFIFNSLRGFLYIGLIIYILPYNNMPTRILLSF